MLVASTVSGGRVAGCRASGSWHGGGVVIFAFEAVSSAFKAILWHFGLALASLASLQPSRLLSDLPWSFSGHLDLALATSAFLQPPWLVFCASGGRLCTLVHSVHFVQPFVGGKDL